MRFIEKAHYFHLDRVEIFVSEGTVCGLGVTYNLDGIVLTKVHKGDTLPKSSYELELQKEEHIEFI